MENLNAYQIALEQFNRAAAKLKLEADLAEILKHPKRQLTVSIPIRMDDGSVRVFEGYRVQHNVARGPALICDVDATALSDAASVPAAMPPTSRRVVVFIDRSSGLPGNRA